MPCVVRFLTPSGVSVAPWAGDSLADTIRYEPYDGVYTITNTTKTTQVLKLNAHLDRLEDSARRADIALHLDRAALRAALREMITEAGWGDVRFRITVGKESSERLILSIEPFHPIAPALLASGTRCITAADSARHNPEAKTTDWAINRQGLQAAQPIGIYDTFLLDQTGNLLEGLASNFYAIVDGTLYTAGAGVLKGISQQIVLEVASTVLPVVMQARHVSEIAHFEEAFLSSSSRGIVPVVEIDGIHIGDGSVGALTRQLRTAYATWMDTHLEEL